MAKDMEKESSGDDVAKKAKMEVLKHIHKMASDSMGEDVMGGVRNKAVVASDSRKGLEEGLSKAAELVGKKGEPLDSNEMDDPSDEEEMPEEHEDMSPMEASKPAPAEHDGELSDDELEHLIAELQSRKMKK